MFNDIYANYLQRKYTTLWPQEDGLQDPPVFHLDTNFTSIKRTNNSVYHYGVMAIWQMRGVYL